MARRSRGTGRRPFFGPLSPDDASPSLPSLPCCASSFFKGSRGFTPARIVLGYVFPTTYQQLQQHGKGIRSEAAKCRKVQAIEEAEAREATAKAEGEAEPKERQPGALDGARCLRRSSPAKVIKGRREFYGFGAEEGQEERGKKNS